VDALKGVDLAVAPGEVIGLIGPSGSGKSTLLKCLGAVIEPSGGRMTLGAEVIYDEGWRLTDLRALRRDKIGFVFQAPYLIPFLDVTDNVALPLMLAGQPNGMARDQARELLAALDVSHRSQAMPAHLSGGEQQRVAIARALGQSPPGDPGRRTHGPPGQRARPERHPHPQPHGPAIPDRRDRGHPRREDHPHLPAALSHPRRPHPRGGGRRGGRLASSLSDFPGTERHGRPVE
jgi:hypothetical protein